MQVKILNTKKCATTGLTFFANKTYRATPATNQPGALRLGKKAGICVNKIFVGKGKMRPDIDTMLLEKEDFTILDFPEKEEILAKYKASKIKIPKIKKILPDNLKLRDGFRVLNDGEKFDNETCEMGKADRTVCKNPSAFVKEIGARKIGRCKKCASFRIS